MSHLTRITKPRRPALALEVLDDRTVPAVVALSDPSVLTDDVVVNRAAGVTDTTQSTVDRSGWAFMTQSYAAFLGGNAGPGLPDDGLFPATAFHPEFRLPVSNEDSGNNARIVGADTGSFSFATPADKYRYVHLAGMSTEGGTAVRLTLTYATGDPVTTDIVYLPDWFDDFTPTADRYYLADGMDRTHASGDGVFQDANNAAVFGLRFEADPTRVLTGVTVEKTSNSPDSPTFFVFFGAYGVVEDTAPTVAADNPAVAADEGQTAANTGTFGDPDADAVMFTASVGSVVSNGDGTWSWSWATADGPAQSQTVTVTASDGRGLSASTAFQVAVHNVNPTATFLAPTAVTEGQGAAVGFTNPADPSPVDGPFHYAFDFDGDGTFDVGDGTYARSGDDAAVTVPAGVLGQGPATHTVRGRILDKDGGFTDYAAEIAVLNAPAVLAPDHVSVSVDEGRTATNTGTWGDPGGDVPTLTASVGTVTRNADGTWSWSFDTHDGPFDSQTVVITAVDGAGAVTTATFSLVVNNVAPDFDAGPDATLAPADAGHFTRSVTFTDPGADLWTGWVDFGDGSGAQQLAISGHTFTLDHVYPNTAAAPPVATYAATVQVSDGVATTTRTFAVTVDLNSAPAARADAVTTDEDHAVTFGVLANDTDAEGNIVPGLTVALTQPAAGVLTNNGDGTFTYNPAGAFQGLGAGASATVTFTYRVTDASGLSDAATVTITITGVNDGPVAAADRFAVAEDGTLTVSAASGLLANDTDPDAGDVLTVTAVNGSAAAVGATVQTAHGTVRVNADGGLVYTPGAANDGCTDSFTYTVSDGHGGTATAAVTVAVQRYVGVSLAGGVLRVGGGGCADTVSVGNGYLWVNGTPYSLAGVTAVRVWGRGGDDRIDLTGLAVRAFVSGGCGDDVIYGGSADDVLLGGSGDDLLLGGDGNDVLVGGFGADRLIGSSGNDLLIGAYVGSTTSLTALRSLGAAWAGGQGTDYAALLPPDLTADGSVDRLTGSSGADWFVVSVFDVMTDRQSPPDLVTYGH